MFAFGPITSVVPAGSPFSGRRLYDMLAEAGVYEILGGSAFVQRNHQINAEGGIYVFDGSGTVLGHTYNLHADSGSYELIGGDARLLFSAYYYEDDAELVRVPFEQKLMQIVPEFRDMLVAGKSDTEVPDEPREGGPPPRLRRQRN